MGRDVGFESVLYSRTTAVPQVNTEATVADPNFFEIGVAGSARPSRAEVVG